MFQSPAGTAIQATTKVAGKTITIHSTSFKNARGTAYRYIHVAVDESLRDDPNNGVKLVLTSNYVENVDTCADYAIVVEGVLQENVTISGNRVLTLDAEMAQAECWFGDHISGEWTQYDVEVFEIFEAPEDTQ